MKLNIMITLLTINICLSLLSCKALDKFKKIDVDKKPTDFIGFIGKDHIVYKEPYELSDCNQVLLMDIKIIMDTVDFSNQSKDTFVTLSAYIINFYLNSDKDDLYKSFYYKEVSNKPSSINYKSCVIIGTYDDSIRFCFGNDSKKEAFIKAYNYFYSCGQNNPDPNTVIHFQKTYPEAKCEMEDILLAEAPNNSLYGKDVNVVNFAKKYSIPYNLDVTLLQYGIYRDTITGFSVTFHDKIELIESLKGIFYVIMFDPKNRILNSSLSSLNDSLSNITNMSDQQKYKILESTISQRIKNFKQISNLKGHTVYSFIMEEYELDKFQNKTLMQFYDEFKKHVDESHLIIPNPMPLLDKPEYMKLANDIYSGKFNGQNNSSQMSSSKSLFNV